MNRDIQARLHDTPDSKEKVKYSYQQKGKTLFHSKSKFGSLLTESTGESQLVDQNNGRLDSKNTTENEELISQNLNIEEKIVKCILIGDKQTGKTLLKNKLLEETSELHPTKNLEIKKKLIFVNSKPIKLELWDTSIQILNSPILQSKLYCNLLNLL